MAKMTMRTNAIGKVRDETCHIKLPDLSSLHHIDGN